MVRGLLCCFSHSLKLVVIRRRISVRMCIMAIGIGTNSLAHLIFGELLFRHL